MPATLRRLAMETDWENVLIIDEKSAPASCELCGTAIRYRHLLQHERFHREISVGCVCASRLTGGRYDAASAERDLRNRNSRLKNFMDLSKWSVSSSNQENITRTQRVGKREFRVTIFKSYGTYGSYVDGSPDFRNHATQEKAMLTAFEKCEIKKCYA